MTSVFISYRRESTSGEARALFKDFVARLGPDSVFMDVDTIAVGRDFREILKERLTSCDVMVVLIGKGWVTAKDESGRLRLEDAEDFVRLEVAAALRRDIPVAPVLVQGAQLPRPEELTEDIRGLAYRHGFELSNNRWDSDVQELARRLSLPLLATSQSVARGTRRWLIAATAVMFVIAGAGLAFYEWQTRTRDAEIAARNQAERAAAVRAEQLGELEREGQFRVTQIDEILDTAVRKGADCLGQAHDRGSVLGACIRDDLQAAQIVTVGMELGGIYRIPGKDEETVWIGSSGYGLRHLPNRRSFKEAQYASNDLGDLIRDYCMKSGNQCDLQSVAAQLGTLKGAAQFNNVTVLEDWFNRSQANGAYKEKYGDAYKVYDLQVDDYADNLQAVNKWVSSVQEAWAQLKDLKEVAPFLPSRQ